MPLLPIQAAFFEHEVPAPHHWNQAVMLACPQGLDAAVLAQALDALVRHHDGLRLRFTREADQRGAWTQAHAEHAPQDCLWVRRATDAGQIEALCADAQRSLDLAAGPLLRALLVELVDGGARLLLVAHHLVIDGVSWRILLEDLQTACAQLAAHQPVVLPDKTCSYQAWSQRLQRDVPLHGAQLAHWQSLAGLPVELPSDVPPGVATGGDTVAGESHLSLKLDQAATQALLKLAPAAYRTQVNDILLTALGRALCAWSGQDRLLIDLEGHGREDTEGDLDLSRTVGWFTSIYPVLLDAQGTPTQALQRVKEQLRQVPHKGLGHGVLKHLGDAQQRAALADLPQPQVVFNYLGQFDTSFGAGSPWQLAQEESTGPWQDAGAPRWHALAINGQVQGGELSLRFSYSEARHRRDTIAALVTRCEAELRGLIALCTAPGVAGATPSDFPLARIDQPALDALPVPMGEVEDLYPLSPMQQGMLFHSVLDPDGSAYLTQLRVDIAGLDVTAFQTAWREAFQRHAILRTGFLARMDPPLQWVARGVDLPIHLLDWRGHDGDLSDALDALAQADLAKGFDLARPPLTRLALVRISEDTHHFIWTSHHLLLDGWSTARLMAEVLRPQTVQDASPTIASSYRDYIAWLQGVDQQAAREYWSGQLKDMAGPTRLAEVWPRPQALPLGQAPMQQQSLLIDAAHAAALLALARREHVTLNTIVQAAWALLLQRCTGQQTVCFGATTAGRPADLPGVEQLLGLFINTVPVVATPQAAMALGDWLRELQAANLAGREHEHTPLSEIQRWSGQGGQALFDSILVFENYPIDAALKGDEQGAARLSALRFRDDTHYPLTVSVMLEQAGEIKLVFSHDPRSFDQGTVAGIAARLDMLLQRLPGKASLPLGQLDTLLDRERAQLWQWHANAERHRSTDPVHMLIEAQALSRPQAHALIHDDVVLSHAELNRRANRLAHRLIALGVRPESRVGLSLERGVDMIVALLAILKAGGAYVPLDPDYPVDRLAYMVKDSGLSLVLTQASLLPSLPTHEGVRVLCVDQMVDEAGPDHDPAVRVHGHHLAYVIYTSGSTGKPKGVCVAHHALAEHAQVGIGFFGLTPGDRMLQFSTLNFDGFIEQVFPTLCAGAAIVLRGPQLWDSETFHRELIDQRISVVDLTTAYWFLLVQDFARRGLHDYGVLRQVHAGGEAMPPEGLKAWQDAGMSHIRLLNTYGPTEATVTATVQDCAELPRPWPNPLPIGRPLAGRQLYVLDANLHLVPPGVAGELCIGGELLARGYGQRPGLTAERFVANAFDERGGRLYRTGDLVRWDAEGRLQYLGRLDHQVKIRGFRIELGEVEAELLRQDGVRQALVLAEPAASGLRLIAYVAGGMGAALHAGALRAQLARTLPDYMVPGVIMVLDALPLNPNGKIDRHALPRPDAALAAQFEAPQGEVEQALAAIWAQVLGAERVGRHDNFFELGGHSLAAIQITALLAQRHGCELAVRSLFEHSSLSVLAALLPAERFGQSRAHRLSEMDRLLTEFEE
nr:non-ribosomal peptide synthetase [Aquabacterium sp. CECT 9606]